MARANIATRLAGLLTLGVFVFSPVTFGYIRQATNDASPTPLFRTDNTAIQFLLNSAVAPGLQSSASGKAVTVISAGSDPATAVRKALTTWNNVSTANIRFLPLQSTSLSINASDSKMVINVGATAGELSMVGGALALTVLEFAGVPGVINGVNEPKGAIIDSDIIINPAYPFSTDGSTPYDLQSVMTHELGHSLSANHTGLLGASMFQFNSGQRFLTADDAAFVNSAYPQPNGAAPLGTIAGAVKTQGGAGVPYALLTAFDASTGVTVGGITNPDGTYSFDVPPGNYQIYAEPLNGAVAINIYLPVDQANLAAGTKFQTTMHSGSLTVAANGTATANITVTSGASGFTTPIVTITGVNALPSSGFFGGPAIVPSGQAVDLILAGAGFDSTLSDSNFAFDGAGITLQPGSVRVDPNTTFNGFHILRLTLNVAARTTPELASFVVTSGSNTLSFSGALVVVPPTPATTSKSVVSSASFLGNGAGEGAVSPGGLYTIFDIPGAPNLGPGGADPSQYVQAGPYDVYGELATTLAGVTVTFDGIPAPMYLAWGFQLNVQVPFEVAGKASTQVIVNYFGSASAPVTVPVLPVQPALFQCGGMAVCAFNVSGDGSLTLNTAANPAARGSKVEVLGTGVGKVSYTVLTGQAAPNPPAGFTGNYMFSIGGSAAAPAGFGGWTAGATGLAQWNLTIPNGSPTGPVSITVQDSNGVASQSGVTIFVK